jgi:hypothetical protein
LPPLEPSGRFGVEMILAGFAVEKFAGSGHFNSFEDCFSHIIYISA